MARKKYYRNGDPTQGTYFNDSQWDNMTEEQKRNWIPSDDIEEQAVPVEVKQFMNSPQVSPKINDESKGGVETHEKEIKKLKRQLNELNTLYEKSLETIDQLKSEHGGEEIEETETPEIGKTEYDREFLKSELTKLGVKYGSRLGTKRLAEIYEAELKKQQ